jgi:Competence protein J (ComJ)
MAATFQLNISHGQICVFHSGIKNPFNDWTQQHIDQGFAWRDESVSFGTVIEAGVVSFSVETTDYSKSLVPKVTRAVEVPFTVPESGAIEIASISDGILLDMVPGLYALRFEDISVVGTQFGNCFFRFLRCAQPKPVVLHEDDVVRAPKVYLMSASPA